jgi:hypothetical protein
MKKPVLFIIFSVSLGLSILGFFLDGDSVETNIFLSIFEILALATLLSGIGFLAYRIVRFVLSSSLS